MFVIAMRDMAMLDPDGAARWRALGDGVARNARRRLWDARRRKFTPHLYLEGSPFRAGFDEARTWYHGGTIVAIQAGLLTRAEIARAYRTMRANVRAAGAPSIGLTLYPPYPADAVPGSSTNSPWRYQNGGDWTWFGARMIGALIAADRPADAYRALDPMIARTLADKGFYEWYGRDGKPYGSAAFKGSAGVLVTAIDALRGWARREARS